MTSEQDKAMRERMVQWLIHQALGDEAFMRTKETRAFSADDIEKLFTYFAEHQDEDGNISFTFEREAFETAFKSMPDVH